MIFTTVLLPYGTGRVTIDLPDPLGFAINHQEFAPGVLERPF
jgi:hypothetical protein